jgi:uncharacterized protein (TIGR02118 family)
MVKLICFVKRKPGMSPEDFHRYWRERHGPLVASTKSGSYARRYEQNHRALSDYGPDDDGYDGVTEQWFESREAFLQSIQEDDYRLIDDDMKEFLDTSALVWMLTDEVAVIVDGEVA